MRTWTRMECARLLEEAEDRIRYRGLEEPEVQRIYLVLSREFSDETARLNGTANLGATLDSIYMRGTEVSGTPLRDGYHFGQTIVNDHGRPYWTGFNSITGITAHAVAGPLSFDVQGEYNMRLLCLPISRRCSPPLLPPILLLPCRTVGAK